MKKTVLIFLLTLGTLKGISQTKNFIDFPYIETSAQIDTLVTPDLIYLNILIAEKDTKGKISLEELESKMENTLKEMGINTKQDLSVNNLASNFKRNILQQQDVLKKKAYSLVVRNAQIAGKVMIALEGIGIANVSLGRVEYSKMEQLKLELKVKAIRKAKLQAISMSAALNQKAGVAIYISDLPEIPEYLQGRASGVNWGSNAYEKQYLDRQI
jgi:uncharacterized protein